MCSQIGRSIRYPPSKIKSLLSISCLQDIEDVKLKSGRKSHVFNILRFSPQNIDSVIVTGKIFRNKDLHDWLLTSGAIRVRNSRKPLAPEPGLQSLPPQTQMGRSAGRGGSCPTMGRVGKPVKLRK